MDAKPARFEVHALPLAAIDAVLQIYRHLKEDRPAMGVNVIIAGKTKRGAWARVECPGKGYLTICLMEHFGATKAILHRRPKNLFFRLHRQTSFGEYEITRIEYPPFALHPFADEDEHERVGDEMLRRAIEDGITSYA